MNIEAERNDGFNHSYLTSFNQDFTSLAVISKTGYKLYNLKSPIGLENSDEIGIEDICLFERLFSSSLVAVVTTKLPKKLFIQNFKQKREICSYTYIDDILSVKMNRKRLVVCLYDSLYIHNINDMKVLHVISDTPPNTLGIFGLSSDVNRCYLAYPGSCSKGEVNIFDTINLRAVVTINAHNNPVVNMTFNSQGNLLATASERGTVIRIFSSFEPQKLMEFRRGTLQASICSMSFSLDSAFLSCSSNTETVHIFKLELDKKNEEANGWLNYFGGALLTSATYLAGDILTQKRDFAVARLPCANLKNTCAFANFENTPYLLVATQDGSLFVYKIDGEVNHECVQVSQHKIDGLPSSAKLQERRLFTPSEAETDTQTTQEMKEFLPEKSLPPISSNNASPEYNPMPKQSYANVLKNKQEFANPEERRNEATSALRDAAGWKETAKNSGPSDKLPLEDSSEFPAFPQTKTK